jgi:hypothetical protein
MATLDRLSTVVDDVQAGERGQSPTQYRSHFLDGSCRVPHSLSHGHHDTSYALWSLGDECRNQLVRAQHIYSRTTCEPASPPSVDFGLQANIVRDDEVDVVVQRRGQHMPVLPVDQ